VPLCSLFRENARRGFRKRISLDATPLRLEVPFAGWKRSRTRYWVSLSENFELERTTKRLSDSTTITIHEIPSFLEEVINGERVKRNIRERV
jgi:hypothetical protein